MKKVILSLAFCLSAMLAFANGNDPKGWQEMTANTAEPPKEEIFCLVCEKCKEVLICGSSSKNCIDALDTLNSLLVQAGCLEALPDETHD